MKFGIEFTIDLVLVCELEFPLDLELVELPFEMLVSVSIDLVLLEHSFDILLRGGQATRLHARGP